jgi:hypothetical protein
MKDFFIDFFSLGFGRDGNGKHFNLGILVMVGAYDGSRGLLTVNYHGGDWTVDLFYHRLVG